MASKHVIRTATDDNGQGNGRAKRLTGEPEPPLHLPLAEIRADFAWNARSETRVEDHADGEHGEYGSFSGLKASLASEGQDEAVIVRATHGATLSGETTDLPFELLAGFRRYRAISQLNQTLIEGATAVPNLPNGHILAVVKKAENALQARIINGRENCAHAPLTPQDKFFLVQDLHERGMASRKIAEAIGIDPSWATRLMAIGLLPRAVWAHWRSGEPIPPTVSSRGIVSLMPGVDGKMPATHQLSFATMYELAQDRHMPEGDLIARYIDLVRLTPADGRESKGEGANDRDKHLNAVVAAATMVGKLVRSGILEAPKRDWTTRAIGPRGGDYAIECEKYATRARLTVLRDAADEAYGREVSGE